jgi:hypothetical protein
MLKTIPFNFSRNIDKTHIYTGVQTAISGSGGFSLENNISDIKLNVIRNLAKYDVTNSVQLLADVSIFNKKLGLSKDSINKYILKSTFDDYAQQFPVDSINIYSNEIVSSINFNQLNSIGSLTKLYSDFNTYVNKF